MRQLDQQNDPFAIMATYKGGKPPKVIAEADDKPRKHEESTLHATFCKWLHKEYPELQFVRHEREKKRSYFMQMLFKVFNGDIDKLPDFEGLFASGFIIDGEGGFFRHGLYIEFKKPGEKWLTKDGKIKPQYDHQYKCHQFLWSIGRCAYFCNDMEDAKNIVIKYLEGNPLPKQVY